MSELCGLSLLFCEASVFCVSLDPKTNTLAVTGGEDDKAFVWRVSDGELLFECTGEVLESGKALSLPGHAHPQPVLCWSWSPDCPLWLCLSSLCPPMPLGHKDSVTCAGFSHDSVFVATGDMSGLIKVWQVDAKEEVWSFEVGDLEVSGRIPGAMGSPCTSMGGGGDMQPPWRCLSSLCPVDGVAPSSPCPSGGHS